MPDDCGCRKESASKDSLSRREFIKTSSLTVVSAAIAAKPRDFRRVLRNPLAPVSDEEIEKAISVAEADGKFQDSLKEAAVLDLAVDLRADGARFTDSKDSLIGMVFSQNVSPSRRMGMDIALTVDLARELLTSLHMIIGRCLVEILCVDSYAVDYRDEPYLAEKDPRSPTTPQIVQPRQVSFWTFPQTNVSTPRTEDVIPSGWPLFAEDPSEGYWHYANTSKAIWQLDRDEFVYRCVEVSGTQFATRVASFPLPNSDLGE